MLHRRSCLDGTPIRGPRKWAYERLGGLLGRARYPGWQFSVQEPGIGPGRDRFTLIAFRAHPFTGTLEKLGPWPLPEDSGEEEVRAAALAAVVATDGPGAADRFAWLAPK